jgi:hypothetical protein
VEIPFVKTSHLLDKLNNGVAVIDDVNNANRACRLWWTDSESTFRGWRYLMIWDKKPHTGYLRDPNFPIEIDHDIPMSKIYDRVHELIVMSQLHEGEVFHAGKEIIVSKVDSHWRFTENNQLSRHESVTDGYFFRGAINIPTDKLSLVSKRRYKLTGEREDIKRVY